MKGDGGSGAVGVGCPRCGGLVKIVVEGGGRRNGVKFGGGSGLAGGWISERDFSNRLRVSVRDELRGLGGHRGIPGSRGEGSEGHMLLLCGRKEDGRAFPALEGAISN